MCSSELLPERLHSPGPLPSPTLPPPPREEDQAKDLGTQTWLISRNQQHQQQDRRPKSKAPRPSKAIVTQSPQAAVIWVAESSPESSRPSTTQTQTHTSEEDEDKDRGMVAEVARQGTITRARERAMQAIADSTYGQVSEVHQGRARVVQVDTSQRRQAAIGVEEVLGLDVDESPRWLVGPVQSRTEQRKVSDEDDDDDGKANSPAETSASTRVQRTEPARASNQQQQHKFGVYNDSDAKKIVPISSISTSQVHNGGDKTTSMPSANEKRAAATSWLRLSTDLYL